MNVCIIYGLSEGSWHGKNLRRALRQNDFKITKNSSSADIIIGHSAGCYMLPKRTKANLILLVGLPYWSGKPILRSTLEKVKTEPKDMWWFKKMIFNTYYLLTQPMRWFGMVELWGKATLLDYKQENILLLRNAYDAYLNPVAGQKLALQKGWSYKNFSGYHDDLWLNPQKYVDLIKGVVNK